MTQPPTDAEIIASCTDELPVGVWVARAPGGEFVFANKAFAEIMGTAGLSDVAVGEYAGPYGIYSRSGTLYPEDRMPFVRALEVGDVVVVDDIVIHRADGRHVNVRAHARPVRGRAGSEDITHVVIAFMDITREVEAERARDEFLSAASHELKTPIAGLQVRLQAMAQALRSGIEVSGATLMSSLEACERQIRRVARLAEELLDVSRIRAGRIEVETVDVDLAALVREMAARFEEAAARAGSELRVAAPERLPGRCDPLRLDQIVANLVTNAIQYGAGRPIGITVEAGDGRARVVVEDQGIGIHPDDHARVFLAFERAVSGRNYAGMGLGLWIVRQLVERLGGTIDVSSRPGQGTTFCVELPWS